MVQESSATFTAGDDVIEATGGQVVVVPAGVAHKFVNSGAGQPIINALATRRWRTLR